MDNELVGMAKPIQISNDKSQISNGDALYFLTIHSDKRGTLRFETEDGRQLSILDGQMPSYVPDAHSGSLDEPVILVPTANDQLQTTKIIENDHVIIIRNGVRYDVTGKKL